MIRRLLLAAVLAMLAVPAVRADDDTLKAGKNAPDLKPKKVHQGELPTLNATEGCVVVEFWATWCGPCMRSIPKLNKLYSELGPRGLQVIGISDNEEEKTVSAFLKKKGSQMAYPVASDKDGEVGRAWMQAAKQDGIPCAFIVGRGGRVLWIGNPLDDNFEPNVRKAMTGRWDPPMRAKMEPMVKAAEKCADVRNFAEAYVHFDEALDVDPGVGFDVAQERFKVTLLKEGNPKAAFDWLVDVAKKRYSSDPAALGELVAMVLKDPEVKPRSVETAERLLEVLGTKGGPKGLAVQAMVAAAKGDMAKAIELQTDAWMGAIPADKPALKRALDEYRGAASRAAASADAKRGG